MTQCEAVPREYGPPSAIRSLGFLLLVGIMAIFLAGPVLGVLSAVVALVSAIFFLGLAVFIVAFVLAVIGFIVWLPIRIFYPGRLAACRDMGGKMRSLGFSGFRFVRGSAAAGHRLVRWAHAHVFCPGRVAWDYIGARGKFVGLSLYSSMCCCLVAARTLASRTYMHAKEIGPPAWELARRQACFIGNILVETISGALLAGMVTWVIVGRQSVTTASGVTTLALIAALGAVLGFVVGAFRAK